MVIPIKYRVKIDYLPDPGTPVYTLIYIKLLAYSWVKIPIYLQKLLPPSYNFIFTSISKPVISNQELASKVLVYRYLVNNKFIFIKAVNKSSTPMLIRRHARLGTISDYNYITAYYIKYLVAELVYLLLGFYILIIVSWNQRSLI